MEKSVPGSGPQFYFIFREDKLIGYNFLIGDTKRYKAFPWLVISNIDEQKMVVREEMMGMQVAFFEKLGMQDIARKAYQTKRLIVAECLQKYRVL